MGIDEDIAAVTLDETSGTDLAWGGQKPPLAVEPGRDLWVFGYGSLMWNPGFPFLERSDAILHGYHRSFCVYSHRYRGTPEVPGLVLGLDRGGSCRGIAFRVAAADVPATMAYLWDREMITGVYRPGLRPIRLLPGGTVQACCFVVDRDHVQYCGRLSPEETVAYICQGHGRNGPNCDYLFNTVDHLDELGIADSPLHALAERVRQAKAGQAGAMAAET